MPFTVSHVAAILPLRGGRLIPSALAVGAMAPDVPLFAPLSTRDHTHGPVGLLTETLVFAVVLFALFHGLFKWPVLALAPRYLRERLTGPAGAFRFRVADVPWLLLAFLVGEATHVLWDAFTHRTGPAVERLPVLATQVGDGMPFYRYAQYGSGVFGLVVLGVWFAFWLRRAGTVADPVGPASAATRILVAVGCSAGALAGATHGVLSRGASGQVAHAVVGVMVGAGACVFLYAVAGWPAFSRRR
ncbi:DUF4184 family protein [Actinocorallia longicatena]|uniref:DUF4184 family protein n=1 Tax=Actinocorallia longicatena TaxID=111803 RepID=A0ABP6QKG3_9ACTN